MKGTATALPQKWRSYETRLIGTAPKLFRSGSPFGEGYRKHRFEQDDEAAIKELPARPAATALGAERGRNFHENDADQSRHLGRDARPHCSLTCGSRIPAAIRPIRELDTELLRAIARIESRSRKAQARLLTWCATPKRSHRCNGSPASGELPTNASDLSPVMPCWPRMYLKLAQGLHPHPGGAEGYKGLVLAFQQFAPILNLGDMDNRISDTKRFFEMLREGVDTWVAAFNLHRDRKSQEDTRNHPVQRRTCWIFQRWPRLGRSDLELRPLGVNESDAPINIFWRSGWTESCTWKISIDFS